MPTTEVQPAEGDCFIAALRGAQALHGDGVQVLIAHGLPLGRGPVNAGRHYWHAWIEVKIPGRGWHAIDVSNDGAFGVRRVQWYRLGGLDPEKQVWRFTIPEAVEQMERWGTYGPWVEGWEGMEDVPLSTPADA